MIFRRWLVLTLMLLAACRPDAAPPTPAPTFTRTTPAGAGASQTPSPTPTPAASPTATRPPPTPTDAPTPGPPRITLAFTGIIVPGRCVQAQIDATGNPDYPYEEVRELLSEADLAVGTLNATISDFPSRTGCVDTFILTGGSENAGALARAGFDVMSVATNHIKNCGVSNCGDRAFLDTLHHLEQAGVRPVGAGENLAEAMSPVVVTVQGVRFAIVSLGQIEATTFAAEGQPGIAPLTDESLRSAIQEARSLGDVVIAMPHWGPEYSAVPNYLQLDLALVAVEAGADLVVGNHTHIVQATEVIDGVPVFYGLGNFVFDQAWSRETQQGAILIVTFHGARYAGHELIPTHVDGDGRVRIAEGPEIQEILERIEAASRAIPVRR